jgi:hypothetical protein
MITKQFGIPAALAIAVIGLAGCSTTVENPPATSTHSTTIVPTKETHTNTIVPVPGPSTNTETHTNSEKTTTVPSDSPGDTSSTTHSESSTSKTP